MSTDPQPTSSDHLLLFRNAGNESHAQLTDAERAALAERWNNWVATLLAEDRLRGGHPLALDGRVVSGPRSGRVTDGPYAETKEVVGGYVIVRADSLDHAAEIARGCPGLDIGLTVEVRALLDRSPVLGAVRAVSA
ncbi:MAG: YciI family protein [Verrucomicrobiota bacterium]